MLKSKSCCGGIVTQQQRLSATFTGGYAQSICSQTSIIIYVPGNFFRRIIIAQGNNLQKFVAFKERIQIREVGEHYVMII